MDLLLTTQSVDITLFQGILLAVFAFIFAVDYWLEGLFIFRPIIVGTVTGAILGDLQTGLLAGGIIELAFAGLTPVGGTTPPDPIMTSIMTVVIAVTTGKDVPTAFAIALPFGLLMQYLATGACTLFAFSNRKADEYAEKAELDKIVRLGYILTAVYASMFAIVAFLSSYVMQDVMVTIVESMPVWLTHGLSVAGGLIPAVGFAMLLNVMLKARYFGYLLIGFIFVTFIPFGNVLPVAIVGLALALIDFYRNDDSKKGGDMNEGI